MGQKDGDFLFLSTQEPMLTISRFKNHIFKMHFLSMYNDWSFAKKLRLFGFQEIIIIIITIVKFLLVIAFIFMMK